MKYLKGVFSSLLLLILALTGTRATAQQFAIAVSNSPAPYLVTNTITYTLFVTNFFISGEDIQVTNQFSAPVQLIGSSNNFFIPGTASNVNGALVFDLSSGFNSGLTAVLTLKVAVSNAVTLTNIASIGPVGVSNSSIFATNVIVVSNRTTTLAALTSFPTTNLLTGDYLTYRLTVTNPGANAANRLVLSNIIPAGFSIISVTPTNPPFTNTNGAMVFNIGTLAAGAGDTFAITVEPTNTGTFTFVASASAPPSPSSTVSNTVTVSALDTTQLVASNVTAMAYDPQVGLMEQTVNVANIGTNTNSAARLIVTGLTNVLYNAVGTNSGSPFVQYDAALAPGSNVNMVLEYFVPTRLPITVANSNYTAVPAPIPDLTPPAGASFPITLQRLLPSQNVMIEFPSTLGKSYTVIYSDNAGMSNAVVARPAMVAPADRVQWIDHGPPKTLVAPTNTASRFYMVVPTP